MSSVVGNHAKRGNVGHGRRAKRVLFARPVVDTPTVAQLSSMAMLEGPSTLPPERSTSGNLEENPTKGSDLFRKQRERREALGVRVLFLPLPNVPIEGSFGMTRLSWRGRRIHGSRIANGREPAC